MNGYAPRLRQKYQDKVIPALLTEFSYGNVMEVPRLEKVVINMTTKEAIQNVKLLETAVDELSAIAGQKAVLTRSRKSIANFKLREGVPIGARVTLRATRMWEFVDRLITVSIPRIRDFRGISPKAFDGRGNYSLGLTEQIIFPEIDYDKVNRVSGMNIAFVTTARTDEDATAKGMLVYQTDNTPGFAGTGDTALPPIIMAKNAATCRLVTTARTDEEARALLRHLGMPFSA